MTERTSKFAGQSVGETFHSAVSDLADGGSLLVASTLPQWVHHECCKGLLGSPDEPHRRVLGIARPADGRSVPEHLPDADRSPDRLRVVRNRLPARASAVPDGTESTVATPGTAGDLDGPTVDSHETAFRPSTRSSDRTETVLDDADVGRFGSELAEAVGTLQRRADDDFAPGELRVCVDGVETLLETADVATVAQFAHLLGRRVTTADGLCHFHASLPRDDPRTKTVGAFVDCVVDLRLRDGAPEMQWTLSDGPTSEWIPLSWITPYDDQP